MNRKQVGPARTPGYVEAIEKMIVETKGNRDKGSSPCGNIPEFWV